jgi:hypothetical protein
MRTDPLLGLFEGVKVRAINQQFENVSFVMAEVEEGRRQHRRILASAPSDPSLNGKPVAYSDTYLENEDRSFLYARHRWDLKTFLSEFDKWLLAQFPEWLKKEFPLVLNIAGRRTAIETEIPFSVGLSEYDSIEFLKFILPVGPITIEFCAPRISEDQLGRLGRGQLVRSLEAPLIGCDITLTDRPARLIALGHWASGAIPSEILNALLMDAVPQMA